MCPTCPTLLTLRPQPSGDAHWPWGRPACLRRHGTEATSVTSQHQVLCTEETRNEVRLEQKKTLAPPDLFGPIHKPPHGLRSPPCPAPASRPPNLTSSAPLFEQSHHITPHLNAASSLCQSCSRTGMWPLRPLFTSRGPRMLVLQRSIQGTHPRKPPLLPPDSAGHPSRSAITHSAYVTFTA